MEDYELDKLATKVLQKHVPNRYPRSNNWKNAMFDFARQYHEIQVKKCDLADVVGSEERAELVCGFCGTNKAEVCFKCHTNQCVSAAGQN